MRENKLKYFEYFLINALSKLGSRRNDFSVLKTQKLLFFTVAAQSNVLSDFILGESLFDDFRAYQYGPVEHTVYTSLKLNQNRLSLMKIDNRGTEVLDFRNIDELKNETAKELETNIVFSIDSALNELIKINPNILNYSAFNLVELSHRWKCWSNNYSSVNTQIHFREIKSDNQYYFI